MVFEGGREIHNEQSTDCGVVGGLIHKASQPARRGIVKTSRHLGNPQNEIRRHFRHQELPSQLHRLDSVSTTVTTWMSRAQQQGWGGEDWTEP